MNGPILEVHNLSVELGGRAVLQDVELTVAPGQFVAVVGPNGAGKTTLLRTIAGLIPSHGAISIGGEALASLPLRKRAERMAYLPQGHVFHWPLPVTDIVGLGRLPRGAGADLSESDRAAVAAAMKDTDTAQFAARAVNTLSGGERARVAMARVLATEAPIILADEPTASLDPRYQIAVIEILKRHARSFGIVLAVVHDLAFAARYADRIVVLDAGRIAADGAPRDVLTADRMRTTFGVDVAVLESHGAPVIVPLALSTPR